LDLRQLTFMDCSGVALMLDEDRFARRHGQDFSLISTPSIQRVLTLCAGDDALRLCSSSPLGAAPWSRVVLQYSPTKASASQRKYVRGVLITGRLDDQEGGVLALLRTRR
jgi:hypothetical protein